MKEHFFIFVILLGLVLQTFCYTCTIDNKTLREGQNYQPKGQCKRYTCFENGFLAEVPCPDIRPQDGCYFVPVNPKKKFPECCSHYKCSK